MLREGTLQDCGLDLGGKGVVEAKRATCKGKLMQNENQQFFYCTKFAVAQYKVLSTEFEARLTHSYRSRSLPEDQKDVEVVMLSFNHQQWQQALAI